MSIFGLRRLPIIGDQKQNHWMQSDLCRGFVRKNSGASMIEFALVAPVFLFFLIAILEMALLFVAQNAIEAAAREAARYSMTGSSYGFATRQAAITQKIKDVATLYSGGLIDPTKLVIQVKAYGDLSEVGKPEPFDDLNKNGKWDVGEPFDDINGNGVWDVDQGVVGSYGIAGQVVLYDIKYVWQFTVPLPNMLSSYTLQGQTPVENEDY
ncbi:MAG: TadE/TadG family type IV pilus assembly protein [Candidatus Nucleicultricaceae bacterium]|jgi:Flp pilus assembly pilin Flp